MSLAGFKMAMTFADGAREGAFRVAEQLRFDERLRHGGKLHGMEAVEIEFLKSHRLRIERDELRKGDGTRDQFFSRAGFACYQRRDRVHFCEQLAVVAVEITGENGLPDGGAQVGGGHRAACDEIENVVERAVDLMEKRKNLLWTEDARIRAVRQENDMVEIVVEIIVQLGVFRFGGRTEIDVVGHGGVVFPEQPVEGEHVPIIEKRLVGGRHDVRPFRQSLLDEMVAEIENGRKIFVDGQFSVEAMPDLVKAYMLAAEQLLLNFRPFCGKRAGENQLADELDLRHFRLAEERLRFAVFHILSELFVVTDCTKIHINIYIKCTMQEKKWQKIQ